MFLRAWTRSSDALGFVTVGLGRLDIEGDAPRADVLRVKLLLSAD
jgi:hypothetical protein